MRGRFLRELVRDTIVRGDLVGSGDHIVLGLSGGPDSVCLFHILSGLGDELGFTLSAVHVNHGFRPIAADEDQSYVEKLCAEYGVPLVVKTIDLTALAAELGETPEEAGRTARYEAFADEAARSPARAVLIAVAHNRNDQIETVLMRIIRGTGTDGLAGMPYRRTDESGYDIIRPLLDADRADIEAYCTEFSLNPRRDYTNDEPKYFRNKVRLQLLPLLRENFGAAAEDALLRLSANAAEDRDYFEVITGEAIDEFADFGIEDSESDAVSFPLDILSGTHPAIRHRLITALFAEIGLSQDIESVHLKAADSLIGRGETGKTIDFPNDYRLTISYGQVFFSMGEYADGAQPSEDDLHQIREYTDEDGRRVIEARVVSETAQETMCFDAAALEAANLKPEWRTRRAGDYMRPRGMTGTKKLQDILVDKKVPRAERDDIMLFAADSEVLWVPGIRTTRMFALT